MLTVAVAHVFCYSNSGHLDDLHHVGLLTPDLRRPKLLNDPRLAKGWPAALRLCEVFEKTDDAMFDLEVCFRFQQGC